MFLFFSKLLPLLVYPLGMTCLLMLAAIILLWQRRRRGAMGLVAIAGLVLWGSSNAWVATQLAQSLEWRHLPARPLPAAEAIVVLGGSTRPQAYPRPWVDLTEAGDRTLHGARLYRAGKAPLLILSGGRIDWRGGGSSESADMARIARAFGVPSAAIIEEPRSLNTYQNAVNVKAILAERHIRQVLLVTSALHMPRSRAVFEHQGIAVIPAPTDFRVSARTMDEISGSRQAILLSLLPDADNLMLVTRSLKEYLGLLVYWLRGWL